MFYSCFSLVFTEIFRACRTAFPARGPEVLTMLAVWPLFCVACFFVSHHITSHRTTGCFKALFLISLNEAPTQYQSHCICSSMLFFLHTLFSFCCLGSWLLSQFPIAPVTCLSALLINLPVSLCFSLKRKKEAGNSSCSYHKVSHLSVLTV